MMNSPPPTPPPPMEVISDEHLNNTWDFDWGSLLDCTLNDDQLDDEINLAWNLEEDGGATLAALSDPSLLTTTTITTTTTTTTTEVSGSDGSDRIRKRDPRLICENFLAGRIPCACPEMDEKAEEEEEDEDEEEQEGRRKVRKKRPRVAAVVVNIRCQVPECGVDITELKGYHRRHRVCLRCANASEVFLDGEHKRYCQQCGKFHILPDFDEGKRSCRRKLERHNKRRRRKPTNVGGVGEKEIQAEQPSEVTGFDNKGDDRAGKDNSCLSNQIVDEGIESEDGRLSPLSLPSSSQNIQSDSVKSLVTSSKAKTNVQKDSSQCTLSSSFGDNKSSYSSLCPAGRISFKLYDWNPAEFPRRLRHQIFQWLDNMPVELEGYIRPGCTILTVFMAMPWFMWDKLSEDTYSYIHDFLSAPESMLFGRGRMVVYLNDMVFQVLKGETSLMTVKVELQPPRLHYVHPTFFEAGKPMEFIICGTNLLRPKFRFLISFAGTYLAYDYCASTSHESIGLHSGSKEDRALSCEHQSYKIYVPNTDPKLFGPAFVEVENESGISNFIPVLIGDRHVCSEMQAVQQKFHKSLFSKGLQYAACDPLSDSCEGFVLRQAAMSELLLDVAWLLKEPQFEDMHSLSTSFQIQRFNCLLNFLIQNDSTVVLEKVLHTLKIFTDGKQLYKPDIETNDADFKLFGKYMECAKQIVYQKCQDLRLLHFENCVVNSLNHEDNEKLHVPTNSQDKELSEEKMLGSTASDFKWSESSPLINREVVMNVNCRRQLTKTWLPNTRGRLHSSRIMGSRRFLLVVGMTAVCFGVCVVVIQPKKVGDLAVSIHRCLFGNSNS